jgi:uncharacterized membrane protein
MPLDSALAILGMALITFAIRAGGFLIAGRLPETGFVAAWLRHIPAAVLIALIAPAVANGGPPEWLAAAVAVLAYVLSRNVFATILMGVLAVFVARQLLGA